MIWRKNMSKNKKRGRLPEKKTAEKKKMVWTKKKIIAASIIGVAVLSAVIFGIIVLVMNLGPIRPIKSTEEEARVVGTVGKYEIKHEELRYVTLLHKATLDKKLGEYDTLDASGKAEYESQLRERVLDDLKNNYVVLALCEKYGIKTDTPYVNEQVQKSIESLVNSPKESLGFGGDKDKYKEWLAENNLTDSFMRLVYKVDYLESRLLEHFIENKIDIEYNSENKADFTKYVMSSDEWARTIHVYYPDKHPWTDPANVPESILKVDKDYIDGVIAKYDPKASVEKAFADVADASDDDGRYKAMKTAVGKTPVTELAVSGNGFYFTYGQMGEFYENTAFALEMYEVSEIFRYEGGYCFMMRLPLLEDDVKKHSDELLSQYQYLALKKQLDAERENLSFTGNDYFAGLTLAEMK